MESVIVSIKLEWIEKIVRGEKVEIEKPCIFGSGNRLDWKPIPLTRPPQSWQYLY